MFSSFVVVVTESVMIAIVAQAILSWLPSIRALAPVTAFLRNLTEPLLDPIRRLLRPSADSIYRRGLHCSCSP